MAKAKRIIGLEILEGIREIKRGEHGRVVTLPAVSGYVRAPGFHSRSSLSCLGGPTLQDWEQGRRGPSGAARTLLRIVVTSKNRW